MTACIARHLQTRPYRPIGGYRPVKNRRQRAFAALFENGAPLPMKIGTIASPWR